MLYLTLFAIFSGLLPVLAYFLNKKKSTELKLLKPFIFLVAFASTYEFIFSFLLKINVTIWFRVYSLIELVVLMFFFFKVTNGRYKILQYFYFCVYVLFFLWVSFFGNKSNFDKLDSYLSLIEYLFVINFSIIWFKRLFSDLAVESLLDSPIFYFVAGLILYFSGTAFLFLFSELISNEYKSVFFEFWTLNLIMLLVFRLLLIIAVWKGRMK